jgi:hypothetical protein
LPQPDGPRRLKNSPSRTSRSMWSTANTSPNFLTTSTRRTSTSVTQVSRGQGAPACRQRHPEVASKSLPRPAPTSSVSPNGGPRIGVGYRGCQQSEVRGRNAREPAKFVRNRADRDGLRRFRQRALPAALRARAPGVVPRRAGAAPSQPFGPIALRWAISTHGPSISPHAEVPQPHADPLRRRHLRRPPHRPGARARDGTS